MGLDTVELIVSFEKYFELEIPDAAAEQIMTVGSLATYLSWRLGVVGQRESAARLLVQQRLGETLAAVPGQAWPETTQLADLFSDPATLVACRDRWRSRYQLAFPELGQPTATPPKLSLFDRLFSFNTPKAPGWTNLTLAHLTDWLVAVNYQELLPKPLTSEYEVEQAVFGITSFSSGVPLPEITLHSSFTNDLGMD